MKHDYKTPFAEIILLSPCDLITTSGVESKLNGEGDFADWIIE